MNQPALKTYTESVVFNMAADEIREFVDTLPKSGAVEAFLEHFNLDEDVEKIYKQQNPPIADWLIDIAIEYDEEDKILTASDRLIQEDLRI